MPRRAPRVALYQPWTGDGIDAGWTRWLLEQDHFHLTIVHNADIRDGRLRNRFDAVVFADQASAGDPRGVRVERDSAAGPRRHRSDWAWHSCSCSSRRAARSS